MDPNALIVQHMLDRQEEISGLRARVAELEQENAALRQELDQAQQ